MITLFTAPKPFEGHIGLIQGNAIRSWRTLGKQVQILLIGDEVGLERAADEHGVEHISGVERNAMGTPLLSSVFGLALEHGHGDVFCYSNADILLFDDLLTATAAIGNVLDRYLAVGRRWDVRVDEEIGEGRFSDPSLMEQLKGRAQLHPPGGSDYFIFPRGEFQRVPGFALGRAGWDNWMIFDARQRGIPVIDASEAITVIHQNHDYSHLPGGQSHYRLPETEHNVKLAGGREMMFTLRDATWHISSSRVRPLAWWQPSPLRRLEAGLYCWIGPGKAARVTRMLLHPFETLRYIWRQVIRQEGQAAKPNGDPGMLESSAPNRSNSSEI